MRVLAIAALLASSGCVATVGGGGVGQVGGPLLAAVDMNGAPIAGAPVARQANAIEDMTFGQILNTYRATVNANPVTFDSRLNQAAQDYADILIANPGHFSHTGLDGSTVPERLRRAGYIASHFAENLAGNQSNEQGALAEWQNSPPHDAALKGATLQEFGLGMADNASNVTRWVLVLATEAP
jgi:uncharacterized protein YkwD